MKKIILIVVGLLLVCGVLFYIFPTIFLKPYFLFNFPESKYSLIYKTPVNRELIKDNILLNSKVYTFQNFQFQTPFKQLDVDKVSSDGSVRVMKFDGVANMIIAKDINIYQSIISGANSDKQKVISDYFSGLGINSNFGYYKTLTEITPAQLQIFDNKQDVALKNVLLSSKLALLLDIQSQGFYSFQTPTIKGFQDGIAEEGNVSVKVFDSNDSSYTFGFNDKVSQGEIDSIIGSIK